MTEEIIELTDEVIVKKKKSFNTEKLDQMLEILSQPSTWKGFVLILGVLGVQFNPDQWIEVAKAVGTVYGAMSIIVDKN